MIQDIKIRNFLSFKDEVVFSFDASNDKFAEESQVVKVNDEVRLLRFAIVYGYNASGKTNLLKVFDCLSDFWFSQQNDADSPMMFRPFKLDQETTSQPCCFEMTFFVGPVKYVYALEADRHQVYLEKLLCYKTTRPTTLFERKLVDGLSVINYSPTEVRLSSAARDEISVKCLNNMSFFAARKQVNVSIPLVDEARDWMRTHFMSGITPSTDLTKYAQRETIKNKDLANEIVKFLHGADFNITDIHSRQATRKIPQKFIEMVLDVAEVSQLERERLMEDNTVKQISTDFVYTVENHRGQESYALSVNDGEESGGTLRTFGLETALHNAIERDAMLTIDELETSLHPKLLEKLLFEFLRKESRSQLLVTTHQDGLLDMVDDLIRKDSVWFTEKKKDGVTDLYKLTDFRGVNRLSSIREAYRNKRFGATMNS